MYLNLSLSPPRLVVDLGSISPWVFFFTPALGISHYTPPFFFPSPPPPGRPTCRFGDNSGFGIRSLCTTLFPVPDSLCFFFLFHHDLFLLGPQTQHVPPFLFLEPLPSFSIWLVIPKLANPPTTRHWTFFFFFFPFPSEFCIAQISSFLWWHSSFPWYIFDQRFFNSCPKTRPPSCLPVFQFECSSCANSKPPFLFEIRHPYISTPPPFQQSFSLLI